MSWTERDPRTTTPSSRRRVDGVEVDAMMIEGRRDTRFPHRPRLFAYAELTSSKHVAWSQSIEKSTLSNLWTMTVCVGTALETAAVVA